MIEKIHKFWRKYAGIIIFILISIIAFIWFVLPIFEIFLPPDKKIGFTFAIILLISGILMDYLIDMNKSIKSLCSFHVNKNLNEVSEKLISYIKTERPNKAYLLEYSSRTISDLLSVFRDIGTKIFLLIQHPEKAISDIEKERICTGIKEFVIGTFSEYKNIAIKCYKQRASYKGRKLSNKIINVGWYTYDIRDSKLGENQIWGHNNPTITLSLDTKEGRIIEKSFVESFKNLWEHGLYLDEVCGSCSKKVECYKNIPETDVNTLLNRYRKKLSL